MRVILFLFALLGLTMISLAQTNHPSGREETSIFIEGYIRDHTTGEALAFATVFFEGSDKGTRSNTEGYFKLSLAVLPSDSITCSLVGYEKQKIFLDTLKRKFRIDFEMERKVIQMKDLVIVAERHPGLALMKKVIHNKGLHNRDLNGTYRYEVYNKLEMDLNKIPAKAFSKTPVLKNLQFVTQYFDSTSEEKPFLPLFLSETISDYYFQSKPKKSKEIIKASKLSGYKNESVSKMLGAMYQNLNVYENQLPIFNVGFVSPVANNAPSFYRYEIVDTQMIQDHRCFHVVFTPKRPGEHTFNGDCWVHDTDYALVKIYMLVTRDQNVNWVNKMTLVQEYQYLDSLWFLAKDKFFIDFLPPHGEKIAGFMGRKTTTYKSIHVNDSVTTEVLNDPKNKGITTIAVNALNRNEEYWLNNRHDSLSRNEKSIYHMIDTIQKLPLYKRYYNSFYFLGTGIVVAGPLEIGSLYNLYSWNRVEHSRYQWTLGTTPKLFKNIYLHGYLAYGVADQRWKYDASALWLLKRNPRIYFYGEFKHDLDNSTNQYDDARPVNNIFSSIGRKANVPWKLAFVEKQRIEFYKSWKTGLSAQLSMERKSFSPYNPLPYESIFLSNTVRSTELGLDLRFAYQEEFVEGNYYRSSLGTKYPVLRMFIGKGIPHFLGSDYNFVRLRFNVNDEVKIPAMGSLYYNVFAGRTFGTLPYPLLEIHPGNEFYYYNGRAFNMMYRYEYLSDRYVGFITEHSLGSLFFKYIPYVKKMKIRTFWNAKGVYGNLTSENTSLNLNKGYSFLTLANSPYLELGTGLENIFKVIRVDAVWRVLPKHTTNDSAIRKFGVFGSIKFAF